MKTIALFGKTIAPENGEFIQQLFKELADNQVEILVFKAFADMLKAFVPEGVHYNVFRSHEDLKADMLFSIGGDGTILDTVPFVLDSGLPVLGINMGRLGFLSSISKNEIAMAVNSVLTGDYTVEQRTLLELVSPEKVFDDVKYALNELNVIRNPEHSLLAIKVFVDDVYLNTYWGDGILLATPTGSTAYSLSAGGPIIAPNAKNFVITPIATHNLTVRPVVIPDDSTIRIQVEGREKRFVFSMDSRSCTLDTSVQLEVRKASFCLNLVRMRGEDFFGTIRNKLMWGKDNRN
ncbi:MAG: NAD kinase [Bacteroidales bacterium]|nr:NAD kinase [Bacteroidales bacterium]MBR0538802.1 NAD kinase [Bacteroidales bacterium]